jgi:hypothetical protein
VNETLRSTTTLSLADRLYLRRRFRLNNLAMTALERMGVALADAVQFLEERLKRGLPAHPVWSSDPGA